VSRQHQHLLAPSPIIQLVVVHLSPLNSCIGQRKALPLMRELSSPLPGWIHRGQYLSYWRGVSV
jgi:hypothetical protein